MNNTLFTLLLFWISQHKLQQGCMSPQQPSVGFVGMRYSDSWKKQRSKVRHGVGGGGFFCNTLDLTVYLNREAICSSHVVTATRRYLDSPPPPNYMRWHSMQTPTYSTIHTRTAHTSFSSHAQMQLCICPQRKNHLYDITDLSTNLFPALGCIVKHNTVSIKMLGQVFLTETEQK